MKLWSDSFNDGERIPESLALGKYDSENHVTLAENKNPHLAWSDLPPGTKSLVLICHDADAPSRRDDANKEGRTIAADLPRTDFFHWTMVDLSPEAAPIREGEFSMGVTPRGKEGPHGPRRTRQGKNDYTGWFQDDAEMKGTYFGYDGPCPPWNDSIAHHYHFTLYAVDFEQCPVEGSFAGADVLKAIEGHVLGKARLTGVYAINPDAAAKD